jgi:predicted AAA+ superfamily ATPase
LEASFIAFRLPSYHGNVSKRLIKMPKLHFYDSGLACWLLGIRDVQQLSSHPLRGAIFESWVVSEIVKSRFNRGESNGVYFFRDKSGVEADVLVSGNKGWSVIEVKASQTVSSQLAANAERIAAMLAGTTMKGVPIVIHGGAEDQTRKGVRYAAWKNLHVPW